MAEGVISHEEVLRHVYSFLHAYGYRNALLALQNESRVPYNTIDVVETDEKSGHGDSVMPISPAALEKAVLEGRWDTVLATYVDTLLLPEEVLFDLYEHIFEELLTFHQFVHASRAFFANSPIFLTMKRTSAARYARLQQLLDHHKNLLPDNTKSTTGRPVPPAVKAKREALLGVLQEAITWNTKPYDGTLPVALWRLQNNGAVTCTGEIALKRRQEDNDGREVGPPSAHSAMFLHYPLQCPKIIREKVVFSNAAMPTLCVTASISGVNNGEPRCTALIVGKTDGTVDFLDGDSAQPTGNSVGHTDGVLSIALDTAPEGAVWVAVGYRDGWVKIYDATTRKLLRRFSKVHGSGVTSLLFAGVRSPALSGHSSWVLSGSYDGAIQVLSIAEGNSMQRIADAHQLKYVLSMCVVSNTGEGLDGIVSAGNNGTLCFWSLNAEGLQQVGPPRALCSIHESLKEDEEMPTRLLPVEDKEPNGEFLVLTRGHRVLLLSARFTGNAAEPLALLLHVVITAPRPLYNGCLQVVHSPALAAPVLSVFLTDRKGAVLLYNLEMLWRLEERGKVHAGGARVELRPTDESFAVVVSHGLAVEDLNVANVRGQSNSLLAYSPSMPTMYILSWG